MARPAKPATTSAGKVSKAEKAQRIKAEEQMRGAAISAKAPNDLTASQKALYRTIVSGMEDAGTLGKLDVYVLKAAVISIDRINYINKAINESPELLTDKDVMSALKTQTTIFFRACSELGLSPQARAKLGIIAAQKAEPEPLKELMLDG